MNTWTSADFEALLRLTDERVWVCSDEIFKAYNGSPVYVFFKHGGVKSENTDCPYAKTRFEALCAEGNELALRARETLIRRRLGL